MNFKHLAVAAALSCASTSTLAAEPYVGGGLAFVGYDESGLEGSAKMLGFRGNLGVDITQYFGLEAQLGGAATKQKIAVDGFGNIDLSVPAFAGLYAKVILPLPTAQLYGLVGYSSTVLQLEGGGDKVRDHDEDFSWGVGVSTKLRDSIHLYADAVVLYSTSYILIYDITAGMRLDFGGQSRSASIAAAPVESVPPQQQESSAPIAPPASTQQPRPAASTGATSNTTAATSLRATPVPSGRSLAMIPAGSAVEVKSRLNNNEGPWAFVRFEGREGWIAGSALEGCTRCGR